MEKQPNRVVRLLKWLNKTLEIGFKRATYTELYSQGAITQEEYLKLVEDKNE